MGVSLKQSHQLMATLATNIDWDNVPDDVAQSIIDDPKGAGREATRFLQNRGRLQVITVGNIELDLDADPFMPKDWQYCSWTIEEHVKGGKVIIDPASIELWLSEEQKGGVLEGNPMRKRLARMKDKLILNANVLDFLLQNPHLIPGSWKGKFVHFFGTVYRRPDGCLYVRYLCGSGELWRWSCRCLDRGCGSSSPVALLSI